MFSTCVCLFVCLFVNAITPERRIMKIGGRRFCALYKNLIHVQVSGSKVKVTGDKKKRKSAAFCSGVVLCGTVLVRHFFGSGPLWRIYK